LALLKEISMKNFMVGLTLAVTTFAANALWGQVDGRMLRYPDVSESHICFVYAGDIWVVDKSGGLAHHLSSPKGEESFPRFSPDGSQIAFSGNYDGNSDIYVVPTMGGSLERVTHHGMPDRMLDWTPDGKKILYASPMASGRQRFQRFFLTSASGGLPERLPLPYGEFGSLSPDGKALAFTPISRDFRTWKRYRGGMAPDIWLFDLDALTATNLTNNLANDTQPMWHGSTVYFLSDRGLNQRHNIWAHNLDSNESRQVTRFEDFDIHFPAIGPSDIVFEAGGELYLLDLDTEEMRPVEIKIVTDRSTLKPSTVNVAKLIQNASISPKGKRALIEARGDVFSVPAEHGPIRNLTRSSGAAERYPSWSPDGKLVAYWSDQSGEYELTVCNARDGSDPRKLTSYGPGYRYQIHWSPDSKKLAFVDKAMSIFVYDIAQNQTAQVDKGLWMYQGALDNFGVGWSPDSRWLAYARGQDNRSRAVYLYDTNTEERHQVTSGYYDDRQPTFDPEGKYLYFLSSRTFRPSYSDLDNSFIYANSTNIMAVSLTPDIPSPVAARNDDVDLEGEEEEEGGEEEEDEAEDKKVSPVEIVIDGFEQRAVTLPMKAGNYGALAGAPGKVVYLKRPLTDMGPEATSALVYYDLEEREEKTVLGDIHGYHLSADHQKVLAWKNRDFSIVDLDEDQEMEKTLRTAELEMYLDPRAEWRQIFNDAWRLSRDFFYDEGMHGVAWETMRERYGTLLRDVMTRWDLNYLIGELIAELNASHTYRGGCDLETPQRVGVGYLGIDWEINEGAYRVGKIIDGANWDSEVRSPLAVPGVDISKGDYILAVNGVPLDVSKDPWSAFQGLADKVVELTVNDGSTLEGSRKVIVKALADESRLRHLAWIESNRRRVDEKSDGRLGYIYVRSTGRDGQSELVRQFMAQFHKKGLVIDERFNSGGQIPDRFIELLNRPALAFWAVRDGKDWQWPPIGHFGPKVMLINGWSGSGGDAFPDYFRKAGLGPLIGSRTWGGLIGMTGAPSLIDGGRVTVPTFRMYDPDGKWFKEGHGVDPDIEVKEDPGLLARGTDPQLERGIDETLRLLADKPPVQPERPTYEDRSGKKKTGQDD
jgi:tricorn protease